MNPMMAFKSLDWLKKVLVILVLSGVAVGAGLKIYSSYKLQLAHKEQAEADRLREEGKAAKADALRFKAQAEELQTKLGKANDKVAKLQAAADKVKVPPAPTDPPPTVKDTIDDLKKMGLEMVIKPSTTVSPSVGGLTAADAVKVWFWAKEAERVPPLEEKVGKLNDLVAGLGKAKTAAEQLAESRNKEAEAALSSAEKHQQEAEALRNVVRDTQKVLGAEKKKKWLYGAGAFALGFVIKKH